MKILLVGTRSRSGSNLESFMCRAFAGLGHDVHFFGIYDHGLLARYEDVLRVVCTRSRLIRYAVRDCVGITRMNQRLAAEVEALKPDLLVAIKAELVLPETMRHLRAKLPSMESVLWFTDDPRYFDSLLRLVAPVYHHLFSVSPIAGEWYGRIGIRQVHHLPVGCDPEVHRAAELSAEEAESLASDVCFVGTYYPNRARLLRRLQQRGFRVKVWGKFWTRVAGIASVGRSLDAVCMARAFTAAKVVLNIHHPTDLESHKVNMRTFEATASRGFLLTDRPPGLDDFFSPGRELVCYESEDELLRHVEYYVAREEERRRIAELGQQRAYRDHTYRRRALALLEAVGAA